MLLIYQQSFLLFFFQVWLCQQHPFKYFLQSILGGPGFLKPQRFSQEKAKKNPKKDVKAVTTLTKTGRSDRSGIHSLLSEEQKYLVYV